jgi:hypothetical protein
MTILDHRFTMNPTVDAWKLIPLDLYNQINNVVNEQRLISKEHALDPDEYEKCTKTPTTFLSRRTT